MKFRDFKPKVKDNSGTGAALILDIGTFQSALDAANLWQTQNSIDVIHIETICLPDLMDACTIPESSHHLSSESDTLYQFIRVWYKN